MPIIATNKGGERVLLPVGNHMARCFKMVYMGEVPNEYKGETKITPKVHLTFELPKETHVFDEEKGPQPFVIGRTYTLSLGDKANLRKDLESWRGKPFTSEELEGFDIVNVLGAPLMIQISTKTKENGDQSSIIQSISSVPKGMNVPPIVNEQFLFNAAEYDEVAFGKLPEWQREEVKGSTEYKAMLDKQNNVGDAQTSEQKAPPADDLPF